MADAPRANIEQQLSQLASEDKAITISPDLGKRCRSIAAVRQRNRRIFASLAGLAFLIIGSSVTAWRNASIGTLATANRESDDSSLSTEVGLKQVALMQRDLLELRLKRARLMVEWDDYQSRRRMIAAAHDEDARNLVRGIESSNRAAFSMLELAQNRKDSRELDRGRLQHLINLYPDSRAAEKASQLLAQSQ